MSDEIKRRSELCLIGVLNPQLPAIAFFPAKGGSDTGDVTTPEPPYCIVWAETCDKMIEGAGQEQRAWQITGKLVYMTRLQGGTVQDQSSTMQALYNALLNIGTGVDEERLLIVNGLDVQDSDEFTDDAQQVHGDIIRFTLGVCEAVAPS